MPLKTDRRKKILRPGVALRIVIGPCLLAGAILWASPVLSGQTQSQRDREHQPERVMDAVGLQPGMVVGEVGAGHGYFTFWLARRVGPEGKIYANDISRSALAAIQKRCREQGITHIETLLGEVEDPLFPDAALDMVFIVNAFHDLEKPVELLNNLLPSLKADATVVIMDRDSEKVSDPGRHFLTKDQVLEKISLSQFVLDRMETFLRQHNVYILRPKQSNGESLSRRRETTTERNPRRA